MQQTKSVLVYESQHEYANNTDVMVPVRVPGAKRLRIRFSTRTRTEAGPDYVEFYQSQTRSDSTRIGNRYAGESGSFPGVSSVPPLVIEADQFYLYFKTDGSVTYWGWAFVIEPEFPPSDAPVGEPALEPRHTLLSIRKLPGAVVQTAYLLDWARPAPQPAFAAWLAEACAMAQMRP